MPSDKKRINLTVTDEIYDRIQLYKTKYGILNDAGACLQLIVQQLNGLENVERMNKLVQSMNETEIAEISKNGLLAFKEAMNNNKP